MHSSVQTLTSTAGQPFGNGGARARAIAHTHRLSQTRGCARDRKRFENFSQDPLDILRGVAMAISLSKESWKRIEEKERLIALSREGLASAPENSLLYERLESAALEKLGELGWPRWS